MENIILVGFMGTGKSAVGQLLARKLGRSFVDLDERIEKAAGKPIPVIFAEQGEAGFRKLEAEQVREAARLKQHVISTGGGVVLNEENVRALKASGIMVCLTARPDVILQRTLPTRSARPLLAGEDPGKRIEELMKLREPFYARADITVESSDRSIEDLVDEIMQRTKKDG